MSWNKGEVYEQFKSITDLSGCQYRIVELATSENNAIQMAGARQGYGVLFNEPRSGEAATVVWNGQVRVRAGSGGLAIGDYVTAAASGWATKINSGMTGPVACLGRSRTAAASGSFGVVDLTLKHRIYPNSAGLIGGV